MIHSLRPSSLVIAGTALLVLAGTGPSFATSTEAMSPQGSRPEDRRFIHRLEHGDAAEVPVTSRHTSGGTGCPHAFDVLHYSLVLGFDLTAKEIAGHIDIVAQAVLPSLSSFALDLDDTLTVDSVRVRGVPAAFSRPADAINVTVAPPATAGDSLVVRVYYHGPGANEGAGGFGGFWWNFQVAFSMGVGLNADPPSEGRAWFPCFDEPCDKATAELVLTVPNGKMAVSNGLLISTTPGPTTTTYLWRHLYPISTYLIAVAVSDYVELPDAYYPNVSFFVYPFLVMRAQASFSHVHRMMDCMIANYGPYPFDKFSYMLASKGDMEHQTCVTHLASLVNGFHNYDNILAHEMSHQWWGDGVTVADWRDVWLSEGFATWSEALYMGWRDGAPAYNAYMNGLMDSYLSSGETTPIYDPNPMWGSTSYEKGASVLHMLRHVLGDSLFFSALRTHWTSHAYANHTSADFQATVESVSGRDLDWFFQPWLHQPGYPVYQWSWWSVPIPGGAGHRLTVSVDQVQPFGLFTMPIDLKVTTASGDTTVTIFVDQDPDYGQFTLPSAPTDVQLDPDRWVLKQASEIAPTGTGVPAVETERPRTRLLPNPSAGVTRFDVFLAEAGPVVLDVIDLEGRRVKMLHTGEAPEGWSTWSWDGSDDTGRPSAPGVYFLRIESVGQVFTSKLLRVR